MIGARASFCAAHKLPQHEEVHGHSYEVWAYTNAAVDAEQWQKELKKHCAVFDHRMLPREMSTMEDIAERIGLVMRAARVTVVRPVEGLSAEWLLA